jgi:hypothetical protein
MRKQLLRNLLFTSLLLAWTAAAKEQSGDGEKAAPGMEKTDQPASNRKAYDALYSDIIRTMPQEGKSKVDSARGKDANGKPKQDVTPRSPDDLKKEAFEKRKKELDELPPEVKARVDKVLSDLDNRRKEKQAEFKELK